MIPENVQTIRLQTFSAIAKFLGGVFRKRILWACMLNIKAGFNGVDPQELSSLVKMFCNLLSFVDLNVIPSPCWGHETNDKCRGGWSVEPNFTRTMGNTT